MPEFDLDSLKKTWQEQPVQDKYNDNEILKMLNRNSRNYMKYIFWISVAEFAFFTLFGLYYLIQREEENSFVNLLEKLGIRRTLEIENNINSIYFIIKMISLVVTGYFVIKFYKNYRKIKVEENLKNFIITIIDFKKTVNAFIITNIIIFVGLIFTLTFLVFYTIRSQQLQLDSSTIIGFVFAIVISTSICTILIWLYYRVIYGIIMSKLNKNLLQLKEIESQES
ncbi:beta-carotene 15,15'-monooxygenase [Chryseobacterium sp.]|uniref:beta-carotene 15,15'-monooxygenase n=1 Tax=Chryseobacterium sp. TaxID=1871047 RepID=UPI00388F39AE